VRIRFGQFDLDSETRQLLRAGEPIHLSPKAFAVLNVLLARRPNVVAKAELFAEIWPDVFVVDGNINVLVGEIRRAIDDDAQSPRFIRTVHGIGYAFCGDATDAGRSSHAEGRDRFWLTWRGRIFSLAEGDNIIGRDPRCEVWVDHSGVSRRHARIRIANLSVRPMLADLGSTNGTYLDRRKVVDDTPLSDGDTIKVGTVTLRFREWTDSASRTRRIRKTREKDEY
jgi:DNA-binding winged helix-turn-helix (wHTH) protein